MNGQTDKKGEINREFNRFLIHSKIFVKSVRDKLGRECVASRMGRKDVVSK